MSGGEDAVGGALSGGINLGTVNTIHHRCFSWTLTLLLLLLLLNADLWAKTLSLFLFHPRSLLLSYVPNVYGSHHIFFPTTCSLSCLFVFFGISVLDLCWTYLCFPLILFSFASIFHSLIFPFSPLEDTTFPLACGRSELISAVGRCLPALQHHRTQWPFARGAHTAKIILLEKLDSNHDPVTQNNPQTLL